MKGLEERPIPWRELVETLFRRRWIVALCTAAGLALALAQVALSPPVYTARARIQLTAEGFSGPREEGMNDKQIQAELAFLKSPVLIHSVLEKHAAESQQSGRTKAAWLRLIQRGPSGLLSDFYRRLHGMSTTSALDREAQRLATSIGAVAVGRSNVIEISFQDEDPVWAAQFVNDLIELHKERIAQMEGETASLPFWNAKIEESARRLREAKVALEQFYAGQGPEQLTRDEVQLRGVLTKLETDRVAYETVVLESKAEINFLVEELTGQPDTIEEEIRVSENELALLIKEQILELEMERTELLTRYTPNSTPVRQVDRQIDSLQTRLDTTEQQTLTETTTGPNPARQQLELDLVRARSKMTSTQARLLALDSQIANYRGRLETLEQTSSELERLENEVTTASEAHQNYLRQAEGARFDSSLVASELVNVSFVERASRPVAPEASNQQTRIVLGTIVGFLAGLFLAFIKDWLDPTVKGVTQASRITDLQILAEIPP